MKRLALSTALLLPLFIACSSDDSASPQQREGTGGNSASGGSDDSGAGGTYEPSGGANAGTGGKKTATGGQGMAGAGTGGFATGGEDSLGGASGGPATGGTGGSSLSCEDYLEPVPSPNPVNVRIVNDTGANVYLGATAPSCDPDLGFHLFDAQNSELKLVRGNCEFMCADMQQGACGCPPLCNVPIVTKIAPGGYWEIGWPGTIFTDPGMPASCFDQAYCAPSGCINEELAPTVGATLKAFVYTEPQGCTNDTCSDCTAGYPTSTCTVPTADHVGGTKLEASAAYTGQNNVVLTFD